MFLNHNVARSEQLPDSYTQLSERTLPRKTYQIFTGEQTKSNGRVAAFMGSLRLSEAGDAASIIANDAGKVDTLALHSEGGCVMAPTDQTIAAPQNDTASTPVEAGLGNPDRFSAMFGRLDGTMKIVGDIVGPDPQLWTCERE